MHCRESLRLQTEQLKRELRQAKKKREAEKEEKKNEEEGNWQTVYICLYTIRFRPTQYMYLNCRIREKWDSKLYTI